MKTFTKRDVNSPDSEYPRIYCEISDLVDDPPDWMKQGLQQTASGYGRRLNTGRKIHYCGRLYRLYATCYSNVASVWFTVKGVKIYVN